MTERRPAEVFHPGEYLLDELNARGWTQTEFAEIINRPIRLVNEIINGKRGISAETAREFSAALETSAEFWMNLDTAYHLWKLGETDVTSIENRARMRNSYPTRDMSNRGWILFSEDTNVFLSQLLRFFEINSLDERPRLASAAAPRRSESISEELTPLQIAWLYRVKHIANAMKVACYSRKSLLAALKQLEIFRESPQDISKIPNLLEDCGIRFVIVEALPSSKIDGVAFWLNDYSPVIGISMRFDRIDNFWFVLRHEIEHILNENGKELVVLDSDILNVKDEIENLSDAEKLANAAAAEFCVPQKELDYFFAKVSPRISRKNILTFAQQQKVHPGLVVGQIQKRLNRYDLFRPMLIPIKDKITSSAMIDGFGHKLQIET